MVNQMSNPPWDIGDHLAEPGPESYVLTPKRGIPVRPEEPLYWCVPGGQPSDRVNRAQARQLLSQLGGWDREMIDHALDVSAQPGQRWQYDIGDYRVRYHLGESEWTVSRWHWPPRYDPVPDLAALIDGLRELAAGVPGSFARRLSDLLTGPYAALRGGLLLDEPGRENVTTEQALREALNQETGTQNRRQP
jgi:hypothetical protein